MNTGGPHDENGGETHGGGGIIREKYDSFRRLQAFNNESLEDIALLQEDLRFVNPGASSLGELLERLFKSTGGVVEALSILADGQYAVLSKKLARQQRLVEQFLKRLDASPRGPLWTNLQALSLDSLTEVGGKAAYLGEATNILGLPTPEGFVLTTQAYKSFCGDLLWREMRKSMAGLVIDDSEKIEECSKKLTSLVEELVFPPELRRAIEKGLWSLSNRSDAWAVRSSAVGEGGEWSFAGQFESFLNVPSAKLLEAYKKVIASRFAPRAIEYRLLMGIPEVENPMAVLFLPILDAESSGVMYTRNPENPSSESILVTSRFGLGADLASGGATADVFEISRSKKYDVIGERLVEKESAILLGERGGTLRVALGKRGAEASLEGRHCAILARWGVILEKHFGTPQDVEWVLDRRGKLWIVQTRPLVTTASPGASAGRSVQAEPILSGGAPIFPGRVSGPPFFIEDVSLPGRVQDGSILVIRRPSPEIVRVLPSVSGVIAEKGAVTGHGAALLRDFKLPSVFCMNDAFDVLAEHKTVSLDAAKATVYDGELWPSGFVRRKKHRGRSILKKNNPLRKRVLSLHLTDPQGFNFKPWGCKSLHDILRFSHEKAVEEMFELNDFHMGERKEKFRRLITSTPMDLYVLDLGGGISPSADEKSDLTPEDLASKPFKALWRGIQNEGVSWSRKAPPSVGGFASVIARSITEQNTAKRALGDVSYLMVGAEHMNLNARLAYHFTMVDASLSSNPNFNYISFRFAGGGAGAAQRALRAGFIREVLEHYGFKVEVRGDLVNAWFKKAGEKGTADNLDILGRLLVSTSQLDMYMTGEKEKLWYVEQFLNGNYGFDTASGRLEP